MGTLRIYWKRDLVPSTALAVQHAQGMGLHVVSSCELTAICHLTVCEGDLTTLDEDELDNDDRIESYMGGA